MTRGAKEACSYTDEHSKAVLRYFSIFKDTFSTAKLPTHSVAGKNPSCLQSRDQMESFLYFLLEHPANTCNFYICIFCWPKQSGMESYLRGFFVFKTVLAWQYHFSGPELDSQPCSTARERLLGPAVSSVPKTCPEARPIFCSQLCLSLLPDYRQVTQTFLKPFTQCISCLV